MGIHYPHFTKESSHLISNLLQGIPTLPHNLFPTQQPLGPFLQHKSDHITPLLKWLPMKSNPLPWLWGTTRLTSGFLSKLIFHQPHLFLLLLTVLQTNHSSLRYLNIQVHSYLEALAIAGSSILSNPMKFSGLHGSVSPPRRGSCWPTLWRCPAFPHSWLPILLTFIASFTASVTIRSYSFAFTSP